MTIGAWPGPGYPPPLVGPTPELGYMWWPMAMPSDPHRCPLVPLVGACCSGCAEGKGCSGKEELEAAIRVGEIPSFSEKALPWSKVEAFDAEVRKFDSDVRAAGNAGMLFVWATELVGFWPRWRAWFDATKGSWTQTILGGAGIAGASLQQFEDFRHEYNLIVDKFKAAGLKTESAPVDTTDKSPLEQGLEGAGKGLGEGVGQALSTIGQGIVWGALLGLLGLGLYFGGPVLIRRLAAR